MIGRVTLSGGQSGFLQSANTSESIGQPARKTGIDEYKHYLARRFNAHGLSAERLLVEIRPQGFTGAVYMIRRFLRRLRPMRSAAATATLRFETAPGLQAQCDWAYCGRHPDHAGRMISVYAFVMVLGFSRGLFVKFTTSMALGTLIGQLYDNTLRPIALGFLLLGAVTWLLMRSEHRWHARQAH